MDNVNGESTPIARGNAAPITMNLVRMAIRSGRGNIDTFFEYLDEMLVNCEKQLLYRYDIVKKLKVKDLPFVAGQKLMMGSENLEMNDTIEEILKHSTWGIGYLGLAECLTMLTGKHHGESEASQELGLKIVTRIREFTDMLKEKHQLNFSCYAAPSEGLCGRFPAIDRAKYGVIPGVTDKDYYTNSAHIPVGYEISMARKMKLEAPYQKLSNAGHISYIELDNYPSAKTIEKIVVRTFDNNKDLDYLAINFHIKYCKECGEFLNDWEDVCKCGCDDIQGISRLTGYLGLDERFGKGKNAERKDRISHENGKMVYSSIYKK